MFDKVSDYKQYFFDTVTGLLNTPSPTGYSEQVIPFIRKIASEVGADLQITNKHSMILSIKGQDKGKAIGIAAHCDTLGAMVRSISSDGSIKFSVIGGVCLNNLDGEYCTLHTREGKDFRGTILSLSPSVHVFPDARSRARDEENMYIRLDECIHSAEDVKKLGISAGDYIFFDTKTEVVNDFLKSRFIDDKASVALCLTAAKIMHDAGYVPRRDVKIIFTMFEEVGHGGAVMPEGLKSLLAVDMGCVGRDLGCDEYKVSICAKDSGGPYDYELTNLLINAAKQYNLDYAVDIYPMYGSDVGAMWRAGNDIKGALIGSGVHASHGMERTHFKGIANTLKLVLAYIELADKL